MKRVRIIVSVLVLVSLVDLVSTAVLINRFGIELELNRFARFLYGYGGYVTLGLVKTSSVAIVSVVVLWTARRWRKYTATMLGTLPWTVIVGEAAFYNCRLIV